MEALHLHQQQHKDSQHKVFNYALELLHSNSQQSETLLYQMLFANLNLPQQHAPPQQIKTEQTQKPTAPVPSPASSPTPEKLPQPQTAPLNSTPTEKDAQTQQGLPPQKRPRGPAISLEPTPVSKKLKKAEMQAEDSKPLDAARISQVQNQLDKKIKDINKRRQKRGF